MKRDLTYIVTRLLDFRIWAFQQEYEKSKIGIWMSIGRHRMIGNERMAKGREQQPKSNRF